MIAKEKIKTMIDFMSEDDAETLLKYMLSEYQLFSKEKIWNKIEEIETDHIDIQMLNDIRENPDCKEFISEEKLKKELGL